MNCSYNMRIMYIDIFHRDCNQTELMKIGLISLATFLQHIKEFHAS